MTVVTDTGKQRREFAYLVHILIGQFLQDGLLHVQRRARRLIQLLIG